MPPPMDNLEADLKRAEERYGVDSRFTKSLREQLAGMKAAGNKSAAELYHSGRPMESSKPEK